MFAKFKRPFKLFVALAAVVSLAAMAHSAATKKTSAKKKKSAYELEKEKALKSPYANDIFDSKENDKFLKDLETNYVKKYPIDVQAGYAALKAKCARCHMASRPLNSQFVEPDGDTVAERKKKAADLKKGDKALASDKNVWQVEGDIWQRYVKRMMAKPGCNISKAEGKKIWKFLAYDSSKRKLGKNKAAWKKHRQGLLDNFKKEHPERYEEIYAKHTKSKGKAKKGTSKKSDKKETKKSDKKASKEAPKKSKSKKK